MSFYLQKNMQMNSTFVEHPRYSLQHSLLIEQGILV